MRPRLALLIVAFPLVARADDEPGRPRVRASATVEVLDDTSKVDDIIARLKSAQEADARAKLAPRDPAKARPPTAKGGDPPAAAREPHPRERKEHEQRRERRERRR